MVPAVVRHFGSWRWERHPVSAAAVPACRWCHGQVRCVRHGIHVFSNPETGAPRIAGHQRPQQRCVALICGTNALSRAARWQNAARDTRGTRRRGTPGGRSACCQGTRVRGVPSGIARADEADSRVCGRANQGQMPLACEGSAPAWASGGPLSFRNQDRRSCGGGGGGSKAAQRPSLLRIWPLTFVRTSRNGGLCDLHHMPPMARHHAVAAGPPPGGGVVWGPGQPPPTHPPTHIKRAGNLRPIVGTQTLLWPLTHLPTPTGGGFL